MTERRVPLGYWLRRRRKALDLTQAELAARVGCVLTTVKKIETGARRPSRQLAERLADGLELSVAERALLLATLNAPGLSPPAVLPELSSVSPERATRIEAPPIPVPTTNSPASTLLAGSAVAAGSAVPAPPGPLIGRAREVAELRALLTDPETRLLTLTGPGGVGKTRLAFQLATELHDAFADGIWFIDLAPLGDPELMPAEVARALGYKYESGTPPLVDLERGLRDSHALMVLDNFEQLVEAAPVVSEVRTHSLSVMFKTLSAKLQPWLLHAIRRPSVSFAGHHIAAETFDVVLTRLLFLSPSFGIESSPAAHRMPNKTAMPTRNYRSHASGNSAA